MRDDEFRESRDMITINAIDSLLCYVSPCMDVFARKRHMKEPFKVHHTQGDMMNLNLKDLYHSVTQSLSESVSYPLKLVPID